VLLMISSMNNLLLLADNCLYICLHQRRIFYEKNGTYCHVKSSVLELPILLAQGADLTAAVEAAVVARAFHQIVLSPHL